MKIIPDIFRYLYNRIARRYQIIYRSDYNTWIVMKDSKIYFMDTRQKCYEFLCSA